MDSFRVVKLFFLCIITFSFGTSAAMNKKSPLPPQHNRMNPEQNRNTSQKSPLIKRHSWSGSRKINLREECESSTSQLSTASSNVAVDTELAERQNFASSLIAGVGSGSLASIVCAPLDLLRTRMQVSGGLARGATNPKIIKSMYEIYAADGLRGCFRGLGTTLATVPAFWGLYFPMYESLKQQFMALSSSYGDGGNNHHALVHLSSAMCAGAVADIVCNPMFVVRTRMQTEALHYFKVPAAERKPHGVVKTISGLYKEGGVPIFWRGLTASLLGLFHVGIQFPVYERLKAEARKRSPNEEESALDLLLASGLSKMAAATITYPHEVIRSRMMDARGSSAGKNILDTMKIIVKNEGYGGLYTGLKVSLLRVVPNCCVTFVSYELIARWVRSQMSKPGTSSHRHRDDG